MKANVIVFEAGTFIFFLVFYYGVRRSLGKSRARIFLLGAILFSLVIETAAVLGGVKNFYWYSQNNYYKHYPLGGYIIWLGLVPLAVALLWYIVVAASYLAASLFAAKRPGWVKAAVAGVLAVGFYLIIEPIAVTNHWWTWNLKSFYLIDVPVIAWVGMFLAVFTFALIYHVTVEEPSDPRVFKIIEDNTIKRWPLKTKKITKNLSLSQIQAVFLYRLLVFLPALGAALGIAMFVFWMVANRGQIPPGW